MATFSLATHINEPFRVSASGKCVHMSAGLTRITITRDEAAHLAADILDAVGATSFESIEVASAPSSLIEALEWALTRIRSAGLGDGEKFAQAEAALAGAQP